MEVDDADDNVQLSFNAMYFRCKLKQNWLLLDNQSTVHMFFNRNLLCGVCPATNPIDIHSSGGVTHCNLDGTIPDFGTDYYNEDGLTNILSMDLIRNRYNISYKNEDETLTVHTPNKDIHFVRSRRGL